MSAKPALTKLYARPEHGGYPVIERAEGIEIVFLTGSRFYQTRRQVLQALTGHPTGWNWAWDRYFRLGRFRTLAAQLEELATGNVFELFAPEPPRSDPNKVLGIDLAKRGHEVRKLLFAGFGSKIKAAGYDPDDVLQEVYKGILVRNHGKCPFDPTKASFGHYVHMVCDCVVSNYHRQMTRQRRVEPLADENDELAMEMAEGSLGVETSEMVIEDFSRLLEEDTPWGNMGPSLTTRIVPLVHAGYGRTEIAEMLNISKTAVSKALAEIRQGARHWAP